MKRGFLIVVIISHVFVLRAQIPASLTKKFGDIKKLTTTLFVFTKDGKQGVVNKQGVIICKPVFSEVSNSVYNLLTVSNDTLYGIATLQGKMVLPYNFEGITIFGVNKFGVYKNGVSFVINNENKYIDDLNERIYTPRTYINTGSNVFVPPTILPDISVPAPIEGFEYPFDINQNKVIVVGDNDTTIVDCDEVEWLYDQQVFKYKMGTLWGIANLNGINIHTPGFESIERFGDESGVLLAKKDNKYGLMNIDADELLPFEYENIELHDDNGFFIVEKKDFGKRYYGLMNRELEFILPLQRKPIKSTGYLYEIEGKGNVDKFMKPVIPEGYKWHQYSNGEFAVTNGKKGGIVNEAGYFIIPPIYDHVTNATGDNEEPGLYKVILNGKAGIVNRKNQIVVQVVYDDIKLFYGRFSVAVSKGKEGVIDKTGKVIIPFIYDAVSFNPDRNSLYTVKRNNMYGMLNTAGKTIAPEEYEYINDEPENGLYVAKKNGKWGFLDANGKIIIPFVYDFASPFYSETAEVQKDGKKFRINKNGEIIRK
jgi:hypothetical protein